MQQNQLALHQPNPHQIQQIEKKLVLASQMLKLRTIEISQSANFIVKQLEGHQEMLKGDYLIGVINSIRKIQDKLLVCNYNRECVLTSDMSRNYLLEICSSVMNMFATLLKQLQNTQKVINKMQKKN